MSYSLRQTRRTCMAFQQVATKWKHVRRKFSEYRNHFIIRRLEHVNLLTKYYVNRAYWNIQILQLFSKTSSETWWIMYLSFAPLWIYLNFLPVLFSVQPSQYNWNYSPIWGFFKLMLQYHMTDEDSSVSEFDRMNQVTQLFFYCLWKAENVAISRCFCNYWKRTVEKLITTRNKTLRVLRWII